MSQDTSQASGLGNRHARFGRPVRELAPPTSIVLSPPAVDPGLTDDERLEVKRLGLVPRTEVLRIG